MLARLGKDAAFAEAVLRRQPFSALVQVTNRCNLRCSFCDFWRHPAPPRDELTVADYERVADELAVHGCFLVSIEGGEPLLRDDLPGIVRAFARGHLPVLFTSGWHVTPAVARELWAAGLHQAGVSIDFPDAARHDAKRGAPGTFDRAWSAVDTLRDTAPRGPKQVFVMTVIMAANHEAMETMLLQSRARRVGHQVTLINVSGTRRAHGEGDALPPPEAGPAMVALHRRYPHLAFFEDYFARMESFLSGGAMPTCTAGQQGLNLDHLGNVATCIETIGSPVGNVRTEPVGSLLAKLRAKRAEVAGCQDCWTACRGFQQALRDGGTLAAWRELGSRMRPY